MIEARKRIGYYEANLAGDAVIIHEVMTNRKEPAWSVDADEPPARVSSSAGAMFVVGESWSAADVALRVDVTAATAEGFILNVERGGTIDRIFRNGFDSH